MELLLTLALISIIILTTTNLVIFSMKGQVITFDEFNIQSNIRLVSDKINRIIRDASGVFVLHRDDDEKLTEEWNYIMVNEDKSKLVEYTWNSTTKTHDVKELISGITGTKIDLEFVKTNPSDVDKLLEFMLEVDLNGKKRSIETQLEAKNALQVIDRSYSKKGNTIAYRYDTRLDEASNAQAVLSMVLDKSGSMSNKMDGSSTSKDSDRRITKMKAEAVRLIDELSKKPNINVSIVPFSSTANDPAEMLNLSKNISTIKNKVNGLSATYASGSTLGGTNTGDGIRRGYYQIKEFNEKDENKNKTNKNFMIILVDGVTTFASVNKVVNEVISTPYDQGNIYSYDGYDYTRNSPSSYSTKLYKDYGPIYNDSSNDYSKKNTKELETYFSSLQGGTNKKGDTFEKNGTLYTYDRYERVYYFLWYEDRYYYKYNEYEYIRYAYMFNGVKLEDYVTGDNNIDNNKVSNDNTYYSGGRYAGNGIKLDPWGTAYVNIIGDMVKKYKEGTNETIKTYIIGFSSVAKDHDSLKDIAMATTGEDKFYTAGDSKALEDIFRAIQKDITDALWHIGGPN